MLKTRNNHFQKSFYPEDNKKNRENFAIRLRKNKRNEVIKKKRKLTTALSEANLEPTASDFTEIDSNLLYLKTVSTQFDRLSLWKAIRNNIGYHDYKLNPEIKQKLYDSIQNDLNLKFNEDILENITFILCNLTAIDDSSTEDLMSSGTINCIFPILDSDSIAVKENTIWCISNIFASISSSALANIIEKGILKKMKKYSYITGLHEVISWAISNAFSKVLFVGLTDAKRLAQIAKVVLENLKSSVRSCRNVLMALGKVTQCGLDYIEIIFKYIPAESIIKYLDIYPKQVLKIIGFTVKYSKKIGCELIGDHFLDIVYRVVKDNDSDELKGKTVWVLELLCNLGILPIPQLIAHSVFEATLSMPLKLDKRNQMLWVSYIATITNIANNFLVHDLPFEYIFKITCKICQAAEKEVQERCCRVFQAYAKFIGEEKFYSSGQGSFIYELMDNLEYEPYSDLNYLEDN